MSDTAPTAGLGCRSGLSRRAALAVVAAAAFQVSVRGAMAQDRAKPVIGTGELVVQGTRYQAIVHSAVLRIVSRPSGTVMVSFELTGEQADEVGMLPNDETYLVPIRVTLEARDIRGVLPADLEVLDIKRRAWSDEDPDDPDFEPHGTFYANAEHGQPIDIDLRILGRNGARARASLSVRNEDDRLRLKVETNLDIEVLNVASSIAQGIATGTLDLADWDLGPGDLDALPETDRIRVVKLGYNKRLTDAGLAPLARLSGVEELLLFQTPLAGDGLSALAGWSSLRKINLFATDLTDAAGPHLARLTGLQSLDLRSTKMTDAGFLHLSTLRALTSVGLDGTAAIGDSGLAALRDAPELDYLSFDGLKITDRGIAALGVMPKLRQLSAERSAIGDGAIAIMAKNFPALTHLDASRTALTDAGLAAAAAIGHLKNVNVQDARTTGAGRARLRAAKPGVQVTPRD